MSWVGWNAAATSAGPLGAVATPAESVAPGVQYTPEQWAQMQQQNWQQWAQWQQQYQQWHQQYGAEYQKSINALSQNTAVGTLVNTNAPPPLPTESKPPPPPPPDDNLPNAQYMTAPPKTGSGYLTSATPQNASYNTAPAHYKTGPQYNVPPPQHAGQYQAATAPNQFRNQRQNLWQNSNKRTFGQQGTQYEGGKRQMLDNQGQWSNNSNKEKSWANVSPQQQQQQQQTPVQKVLNLEELTEAEKKFDKEFAAWEAQFNKWKEQNANHPDKTQYMEYEKKWESWRNSLLDRREQMRKKRLALLAAPSSAKTVAGASQAITEIASSEKSEDRNSNLEIKKHDRPVDLFSKPPPTQNNEPLSFKPMKGFPGEELLQNDNNTDFLKGPSLNAGGIPGLDLVKGGDDNGEREEEQQSQESATETHVSKGPDLDAISKGINSILGDPKLMNMLSMVSQNQNLNIPKIERLQMPAIPRLMDLAPTVPSIFEQSNQGFDDVLEHQREAVTNFDDQTRMSFSNGPNEEGGYGNANNFNNRGLGGRLIRKENRFGTNFTDAKNQFAGRVEEAPNHDIDNNERDNFNKLGNNFHQGVGFSRGGSPGKGRTRGSFNRGTNFNRNDQYKFDNYPNERYEDYGDDNHNNNYEEYNDEDDYDKFHERFNDGDHEENTLPSHNQLSSPFSGLMNKPSSQQDSAATKGETVLLENSIDAIPTLEQQELFVPEIVIDYEHKSIKPAEPEIALEPIYMFDYRHKPVSRIPYPQRPRWLYDAVKNIRQFDPLGGGRFGFERTPLDKPLLTSFERKPDFDKSRSFESDMFERRSLRFENPMSERDREYDRFSQGKENYSNDRFGSRVNFERNRESRDEFDRYGERKMGSNRDYNKEYSVRCRDKQVSRPRDQENNLEFEELSDDDFDDHRPTSEKKDLYDTPGGNDRESPDLSHATNPANPEHGSQKCQMTLIEDLVNPPGRYNRPPRMVIILRGPPGSGKTYLAKLIKDKEVENGGSAPRILSLDDYFLTEHEKQVMEDGKLVKIKEMKYEYEVGMEDSYRQSLVKSFKKTITDGYFNFVIVDNVNDKVKYFGEMWSFAKQNGFQVYICQMDLDPQLCTRRNIHNRSEADIEECIAAWEPTPSHHPMVDATNFLQSFNAITEVEMEELDCEKDEREGETAGDHSRSKWDTFDCSINNLAKLDGVNKPLRQSRTMEEYLQLDDDAWEEPTEPAKPGQKRVRWADLEEQKQQKKMRALGFVVGHTNWDRMMDPSSGANALRQTKYIERVNRF